MWGHAGLQKVYRIQCMDSEILQATVDSNSLPTSVVASAKELSKYDSVSLPQPPMFNSHGKPWMGLSLASFKAHAA